MHKDFSEKSQSRKKVIEVEGVSKTFNVALDKVTGIKQKVVNFHKRNKGYRQFSALKDISFYVEEGDFFGIVGRNGSGKSTLLKILAEIYVPDEGSVRVNGSLMPFIELGVGFNDQLTARENVYLNGAMIGFSRQEVDGMYKDIVDFAELHDFMEEKLKNFSSGMKVRLAFSIAIRAPSDILLLDEVLAVGDEAFREKCNNFFMSQKGKRTIVLVTHDMGAVEKYCNKALFLNESKVQKVGDSSEIALLYRDLFAKEKDKKNRADNKEKISKQQLQDIRLKKVGVSQNGKNTSRVKAHEDFRVEVLIDSSDDYKNTTSAINIINSQGAILLATSTKVLQQENIELKKGLNKVLFDIENIYTEDNYHINVAVADEDRDGYLLFQQANVFDFSIEGVKTARHSLTHPKVKVEVLYE